MTQSQDHFRIGGIYHPVRVRVLKNRVAIRLEGGKVNWDTSMSWTDWERLIAWVEWRRKEIAATSN